MTTAMTQRFPTRKSALHKPVNARSLQMMVSSGVVRQADSNPLLLSGRRGLSPSVVSHAADSIESSTIQRWLLRVLDKRKIAASV